MNTPCFVSQSPETKRILKRLTPIMIESLRPTKPTKMEARGDELIIDVSEMPDCPFGWNQGNRCIVATLDDATNQRIEQWRTSFRMAYGMVHKNLTEDNFPEPHMTIIRGHSPTAHDAKRALVNMMPRKLWKYDSMAPLGPERKEGVWGAVTTDLTVYSFLAFARNNILLNQNLPNFTQVDHWERLKGTIPGILPHTTLVRGLEDTITLGNKPPLPPVNDSVSYFTGLIEYVDIERDGVKITFRIKY